MQEFIIKLCAMISIVASVSTVMTNGFLIPTTLAASRNHNQPAPPREQWRTVKPEAVSRLKGEESIAATRRTNQITDKTLAKEEKEAARARAELRERTERILSGEDRIQQKAEEALAQKDPRVTKKELEEAKAAREEWETRKAEKLARKAARKTEKLARKAAEEGLERTTTVYPGSDPRGLRGLKPNRSSDPRGLRESGRGQAALQ